MFQNIERYLRSCLCARWVFRKCKTGRAACHFKMIFLSGLVSEHYLAEFWPCSWMGSSEENFKSNLKIVELLTPSRMVFINEIRKSPPYILIEWKLANINVSFKPNTLHSQVAAVSILSGLYTLFVIFSGLPEFIHQSWTVFMQLKIKLHLYSIEDCCVGCICFGNRWDADLNRLEYDGYFFLGKW